MSTKHTNDEEIEDIQEDIIEFEDDVKFEENDSENAEISKDAKLKKLRQELKEMQKERDEYLTGLQRARADYINLQKSEEAKRKDLSKTMKIGLVEDLLPVLDAFDGAMSNQETWNQVDPKWRIGVEYIYQNLMKTIGDWGVEKEDAQMLVGKPFDPNLHEPAGHEESDLPEDTITKVIQSGYKIGETSIRAAKVMVSGK